jgi:hypothetical protein
MRNKIVHLLLVSAVGGVLLFAGSALGQNSGASPSQPTPAQPNPNPAQPNPSPARPNPTQGAGPGVYDPGHPYVNQVNNRLEQQKQSIQQGVHNGTLNRQQAQQLWRNDQRVAHQEKQDMAHDGGHLTKQEHQQLNRELNQNGKRIHQDKHQ